MQVCFNEKYNTIFIQTSCPPQIFQIKFLRRLLSLLTTMILFDSVENERVKNFSSQTVKLNFSYVSFFISVSYF